jgi:hypothetical protein
MRCKTHQRRDCTDARCREDRRRQSSTSAYDPVTDPASGFQQTVYGGDSYSSGSSSSDFGSSSSSSSSDSGSSSCGGGE